MKNYFLFIKKIPSILLLVCACMLPSTILKADPAKRKTNPAPLAVNPVNPISPKIDLSNPYQTVLTHFMFLSTCKEHQHQIGIIFINGETSSFKRSIKMAMRLKDLLTLKGVNVDTISNNANYIDPLVNLPRYILSKKLPKVYLIKHGETWRYSQETVEFIKKYEESFQLRHLLYYFLPKPVCKKQVLGLFIWQYIMLIGLCIIIFLNHKIMPCFFKFVVHKLIGSAHTKYLAIERLVVILMNISLFRMVLNMLQLQTLETFMNRIIEALISFILMCLAYKCVNIIQERISIVKKQSKFLIHILPLCGMVVKVIIVLMGLIQSIENLGFKTEYLVQAISFSTLGFGLASQDTIKNLFGSLMIIIDGPFSVGDEIVTGVIRGKVEEIGLRATLLRTKEGSLVYFPNAKLADTHIDNFGKRNLRMISLELSLNYEAPLEQLTKFIKGLLKIANRQPLVNTEKTSVYFDKTNEKNLTIMFNIYLNTTEGKLEQECKNTVIPLILKLAYQLNLRLGHV